MSREILALGARCTSACGVCARMRMGRTIANVNFVVFSCLVFYICGDVISLVVGCSLKSHNNSGSALRIFLSC